MYIKKPIYCEPYDYVNSLPDFDIHMSKEDAISICGLIREYRPKKIVELGVLAGGSTCMILKCLEYLGMEDTKVISADLDTTCYSNREKNIGYLLTENTSHYKLYKNHTLLTGKYPVECLSEIGEDIDFLFIDTIHTLPGEVLDFLLVFPKLSPNAIVVFHDTNMHNLHREMWQSNRVLINSITATKFFNSENAYLNVGALKITPDTAKNMEDVFSTLLLPWYCYMNNSILDKYEAEYQKHYSNECLDIWKAARKLNVFASLRYKLHVCQKRLYVYGCGNLGTKLIKFLHGLHYELAGVVVSDDIDINTLTPTFDEKIYHFSDIPSHPDDCLIILGTLIPEVQTLLENSSYEYYHPRYEFFNYIDSTY